MKTIRKSTVVGARLEFRLVFDTYVLSGSVSQINHVLNRKIEGQSDVTQEEVDQLVAPLFDIVKRLAYEVTEIALDQPGVKLNFQSEKKKRKMIGDSLKAIADHFFYY